MTCPDCRQELDAYPCACGYEPKQLQVIKPKENWIIQTCSNPGCTVVIRSRVGTQDSTPMCKWHREGIAYNTRPQAIVHEGTGPALSKDEFGLDLYEAIRLNAGRLQCERMGQTDRAKALANQLAQVLQKETIGLDDLHRILDMHN